MSFLKKIGNFAGEMGDKAKNLVTHENERIENKKSGNVGVMNFLLRDDVINKYVQTVFAYTKTNFLDPLSTKIENGEVDKYFDEMFLVDYFLQNEFVKDYAVNYAKTNFQSIEKITGSISLELVIGFLTLAIRILYELSHIKMTFFKKLFLN